MIPVLKEIYDYEGLSIFETKEKRLGVGFEILPCDLETENSENYQRKLLSFIRGLRPSSLARIQLYSIHRSDVEGFSQRAQAINELGYSKKKVLLFVELHGEPLIIKSIRDLLLKKETNEKEFQALQEIYDLAKQSGLEVVPIEAKELKTLFPNPKEDWAKKSIGVQGPKELIGVIRLHKHLSDPINEFKLSQILEKLPEPYEIHVSWQRIDSGKMKFELERRLKQSSSGKNDDPTQKELLQSTIETLNSSLKNGTSFVEFEFLVLLKRNSESLLRDDLKRSEVILSELAEFKIESFGGAPSFLSTLLGNSQHVTLKEVDETFCLFLPLWREGERKSSPLTKRDLPLLRNDRSLHQFDLFSPQFSVYNTVIIGTSGKGKSVLTGLLTKSLLNDPDISVIKIDVGGSHSKECELFGGKEHILQLGKSSGINPFDILLLNSSDSEKIGILTKFLSVLIQEQGEVQFSKDIRSQIEECLKDYMPKAINPSLQEFYDSQNHFPRRNLLKRWVKGGAYESAFELQDGESVNTDNRLRYYNFSQVFQASDPEFAQAGMAAVLAQFNIETLKNNEKRIVLICDETPFFIKACFEFFKFSTANVRKFGHAVVLITQLSTDLIVNGDSGILENSPQRFLFSTDGPISDYQARLGLSDLQAATIKALRAIPEAYSEVFLQTGESGRKLRIEITKQEYWELTSSMKDRMKLQALRAAVPSLTLKEAISCLSLT